jgi:hypothetical protein
VLGSMPRIRAKDNTRHALQRCGQLLGHWVHMVRLMPLVTGVRLAPGLRHHIGAAVAAACGTGAVGCRPSCRLYFRLIRLCSLTFAYYRVTFPTQVKDGGD